MPNKKSLPKVKTTRKKKKKIRGKPSMAQKRLAARRKASGR